MMWRPPRATRTDALLPYTTLVRSFEQIVRDAMAERIARKVNLDLTTGDDTGDPNGIVTASTLGKTTAAVAAFSFDELMDLVHSIAPAYRAAAPCRSMFKERTLLAMRTLKGGRGKSL